MVMCEKIRKARIQAGLSQAELAAAAGIPVDATDYDALEKEKAIQKAMLEIRTRYGRNSVVKGFNMLKGATTIERNGQIGGHNSGL